MSDCNLIRHYRMSADGRKYQEILLSALQDGVVLSHLINTVKSSTIDIGRLNRNVDISKMKTLQSKALFEVNENLNRCIDGAKRLSKHAPISIVNLGSNDILDKNVDIVLGLVWQLIRASLVKEVNLVSHPALIRLLNEGETLQDLIQMSPERLLLRW